MKITRLLPVSKNFQFLVTKKSKVGVGLHSVRDVIKVK
jgi:hypothetical protein